MPMELKEERGHPIKAKSLSWVHLLKGLVQFILVKAREGSSLIVSVILGVIVKSESIGPFFVFEENKV